MRHHQRKLIPLFLELNFCKAGLHALLLGNFNVGHPLDILLFLTFSNVVVALSRDVAGLLICQQLILGNSYLQKRGLIFHLHALQQVLLPVKNLILLLQPLPILRWG